MNRLMTAFWIVLPFGAALSGVGVEPGEWYAALKKPAWNPPGWLFGPVWFALYLLMGIAAAKVWNAGSPARRTPIVWFCVQLALNALWSRVFFGWHQMGWALVNLVALCVTVLITMVEFRRVRPAAGALLMPYFAWICFAAVLNFTLWRLNS
jgi:benzodiazapine receptor